MAGLGRVMRRFTSHPRLNSITDSNFTISAEAPQVNLPHVDTQLNMHQFNGFFEDGSTAADGLRGRSNSVFIPALLAYFGVQIPTAPPPSPPTHPPALTRIPKLQRNGRPSATRLPRANPDGSSITSKRKLRGSPESAACTARARRKHNDPTKLSRSRCRT